MEGEVDAVLKKYTDEVRFGDKKVQRKAERPVKLLRIVRFFLSHNVILTRLNEERMIKFADYEISRLCSKEPRRIIIGTAEWYLDLLVQKTGSIHALANLYLLRKTIRTFDGEEDLVGDLTQEIKNQIKLQRLPVDNFQPFFLIACAISSGVVLGHFIKLFLPPHLN